MPQTTPKLLVAVLLGLSLSRSASPAAEAAAAPPSQLPLVESSYWVYRGTVRWTEGGRVEQREMTWRMEVIASIRRGEITGHRMRGHPWDLIFYEAGRKPGEYAILQVGRRFYATRADALKRLEDGADDLEGLVDESDLILDFPLTLGKKFGDAEMMRRADGWYCWVVEETRPTSSWNVAGVPRPDRTAVLSHRTNPDHTIVDFAEGIGIVRYRYVHHGTVSEVDMTLVEHHRGPRGR